MTWQLRNKQKFWIVTRPSLLRAAYLVKRQDLARALDYQRYKLVGN